MSFQHSETDSRFSTSSPIINLQDRYSNNIMDRRKIGTTTTITSHSQSQVQSKSQPQLVPSSMKVVDRRKMEYQRSSFSQGGSSGRRLFPVSYFSLESLLLLICLTASLLILPLILPPLPPPPFLLLLLPIGILAVLMILAFMPTNTRDLTYTYV